MFVGKINNTSFKGYNHVINDCGGHGYRFNFPHDKNQNVEVEIYKIDKKDNAELIETINLKDKDTVSQALILNAKGKGERIGYIVKVDGSPVADSGYFEGDRSTGDGYNIMNIETTSPFVRGQAILTMPDIHRPGAYYRDFNSDKTGSIVYDIEKQKDSEKVIRTFSNKGGGTIAGIEYDLDKLKDMGVKMLFMTPVWGADSRSSHRYWNKNNMQISDDIGNIDNYETLMRKFFKNGIVPVDDLAITSEGLEGVLVQYVLRWANHNPPEKYLFRMNGLDNGPVVLGVVPNNKQNLRHRVVNPSVIYNAETKKVEKNPEYDSSKETYFQIYDISQVSEEQLKNKNELIESYQNVLSDNKLAINSSNDTIINYAFEITPKEYENRLNEFVKMNKNAQTPVELDSPEGTLFIGQFTNFKIGTEAEGAVFWDANKDLVKNNYQISSYDEKLLSAIPDVNEREQLRTVIKRANCAAKDFMIQATTQRLQTVRDAQILYTAQVLKDASTKEDIDKLIAEGVLPKEAALSETAIKNIKEGWYELENKGVESKDDLTLKALMKLPINSLELGDNTVGVLSSGYFSKKASDEEGIGLSRFEFFKQGAGVYSPYHKTYHNVDNLYAVKVRDFADEVVNKLDELSDEKLLDDEGYYTEYGEYVIDLIGKDIAKYAFLKAFARDKLQAKVMPDDVLKGKITYNYPELRKATTLKSLGINASTPEGEAKALLNVMSEGLSDLDSDDVNFLANAFLKRIENTSQDSFELAEAIVNKSGLGLSFRLDAMKDVVDIDAIRNGSTTFDEAWDQVIDFWKTVVKEVKKVNPNAYIVAEITDMDQIMKAIYGNNNVWTEDVDLSIFGGKYKNVQDALREFYNQTGITSEAGYTYTFTNLLRVFSADAEEGNIVDNPMKIFKDGMTEFIQNKNLDTVKGLWSFADNHDKPSIIHAMALDMELFHTDFLDPDFKEDLESCMEDSYENRRRNARIAILKELTNSDSFKDLPLEAMMNMDNKEYFRTASPRSASMSQLMRKTVNETDWEALNIDNDTVKELKKAIVDLTNGNYLNENENINLTSIDIPELQTMESALDEILAEAKLKPDNETKNAILSAAKEQSRVKKYAVRGDFDWKTGEGNEHWAAQLLCERAGEVLGEIQDDYMQYSPYTVSVASLLLDAYCEVTKNSNIEEFKKGTREFVQKYDRKTIAEHSSKLPFTENPQISINKKAYAARDIETVIEMIIQQAEFNRGMEYTDSEKDAILKSLYENSTKKAVNKALMYAAFMSAIPGIPTQFYRDILGGLGYDEKAKNIFLQNRNTVKYSELEEDGPLKDYRNQIFNAFKEVMQIRSQDGLSAINNGTPYVLETNNDNVMSVLYQGDKDDSAITIMNATGINPHSLGENKDTNVELEYILLPAALALPIGATFISTIDNTNTPVKYVIDKLENGRYCLARADKKKIILNEANTKHGAMFLKQLKKVVFKGKQINKQYNIVTNPYQKGVTHNVGRNLSVIAK